MRVLLVSAAYPPDRCGVGDYASHLARRLAARKNVDVAVLTAAAAHQSEGPTILLASSAAVHTRDLFAAARRFRADLVHVQRPTRRATSPLVPFFAKRVLGMAVIQTWHEHIGTLHWTDRLSVPALDAVFYLRTDLPERMRPRLRRLLGDTPLHLVRSGRTIPAVRLSDAERARERARIGSGSPVVAFFGFPYPNKAVHLLFEILDPQRHHLLLICDLDRQDEYQRGLAALAEGAKWRGRVTVTGFVAPTEAARLLAVADAVMFPIPEGTGPWNTSVHAALASGTLVIATTAKAEQIGYDAQRNLYLAPCGDIAAMRAGLELHLGARLEPDLSDDWDAIAGEHEELYARLLRKPT
jgi:glycosyltransferase involved in cell wall biosynthesis